LIKAILFDFDGVITIDKTGSKSICSYISSEMEVNFDLFSEEYRKYNEKLLMGKIEHKNIWNELCRSIGKEIPYQILIDSFRNTKTDNRVIDLIHKYKKSGYKIAMVTDNKYDRINEIVKWNKWSGLFDCISVSARIGSGKENNDIFLKTINELNVKSEECIFIDNTEKNLIAPNKMCINTIFYNDEEKNIEELEKRIQRIIEKRINVRNPTTAST